MSGVTGVIGVGNGCFPLIGLAVFVGVTGVTGVTGAASGGVEYPALVANQTSLS